VWGLVLIGILVISLGFSQPIVLAVLTVQQQIGNLFGG
jgi:hypothetical protein